MTGDGHPSSFGMPGEGAIADARGSADGSWLAGRGAIVTGGGRSGPYGGIGYVISLLFARNGARVAVVDRDPAAAEVTVSHIRTRGGDAFACPADVSQAGGCERAVRETMSRFGRVDTVANNAAPGDRALLFDVTPQRWDELIAANLTSAWLMTREAAAAMTAGGSVLNVASAAAGRPGPGTVYGIARAGLEDLTRGAASLLGPRGIRVNCIALNAEGTGWDAAYAALFLASDRARWVSGHILAVNGQTGPVTCEESQASRVSAGARRQRVAGARVRPPARAEGALRSC
jgi:NAD(P)-dependent dehydrogenase (short-subunit alcohol dehydrogenase family)